MRKFLLCMMVVLLAPISHAYASDVGFSFGINFGYPGAVAPGYAPQPVVIAEPPQFIEPPGFGFYMAIGGPYDLFFLDNAYYLCLGNVWYVSPYYNGPWETVYYNDIPYALRRYPYARIHNYRDYYSRRYSDFGDWRGYHHFRPGRRDMDRDRRDWGRPAFNAPGRTNHSDWNRPGYNSPNRPYQGNWNRPAFNNSGQSGHGNWSRPAKNVPVRPYQGNWNRPAYNSPNRQDYGTWRRPAYNNSGRSDHGNWNRPANNVPARPYQGKWNRPSYTPPNRAEHGTWSRPAYNNSGRSGHGNLNRPAYRSLNTADHGNGGRQANASPNGHDHGNRGSERRER
jgi:hypothetical protein